MGESQSVDLTVTNHDLPTAADKLRKRHLARRFAGRPVFFGGYANGWIGYLPTAEEYPTGGYEVELAPSSTDITAAGSPRPSPRRRTTWSRALSNPSPKRIDSRRDDVVYWRFSKGVEFRSASQT